MRSQRRGRSAPPPWILPTSVLVLVVTALIGVAYGISRQKPTSSTDPLGEALLQAQATTSATATTTGADRLPSPSAPTPLVVPVGDLSKSNIGAVPFTIASYSPPTDTRAPGVLPSRMREAYLLAVNNPDLHSCKLSWRVLAGIGEVLTGNARGVGSTTKDWNGRAHPELYGPELNGKRGALFVDTDNGTLDHSRAYDRIVGPMALLPQAWASFGIDGNHDGRADPQQIEDASLAAARFLCHQSARLDQDDTLRRALQSYDPFPDFADLVIRDALTYK